MVDAAEDIGADLMFLKIDVELLLDEYDEIDDGDRIQPEPVVVKGYVIPQVRNIDVGVQVGYDNASQLFLDAV
jgi:hypothetical protein